jgi:hypothetical protein
MDTWFIMLSIFMYIFHNEKINQKEKKLNSTDFLALEQLATPLANCMNRDQSSHLSEPQFPHL